jgi:hypothetical protein
MGKSKGDSREAWCWRVGVLVCWRAEELLLLLPFVSGTEVEDLGTKALVRFLREDPTLTDEPIFLYMPKATTW